MIGSTHSVFSVHLWTIHGVELRGCRVKVAATVVGNVNVNFDKFYTASPTIIVVAEDGEVWYAFNINC